LRHRVQVRQRLPRRLALHADRGVHFLPRRCELLRSRGSAACDNCT
jgi:hypothetical protein